MRLSPSIPQCLVLLISDDKDWRANWSTQLRMAENKLDAGDHAFELVFEESESGEAALEFARAEGRLQAVVIDAQGADASGSATSTSASGRSVVADLRGARSEIDLFLAVPAASAAAYRETLTSGVARIQLVDRDDSRGEVLWRRIHHALATRVRTPFADTLRQYVEGARDAWHTPGHSSGDGLRESPWIADFHRLMGEHVFNADLSVSVRELDSLLEPSHIIQQAQELAATAFGAHETFFVTGGTSTANKVVIQHLLGNGGTMLVDQACHKSIHHAAVLFGVRPVYLRAAANLQFGLYGPVPKQTIFDAIERHRDAKLLVLTSCSYDGFCYDLEPIIARAHGAGLKVLIDEAWYAHGFFHERLRPVALECGADYVTQSTHKMLSAFSQASMIHVQDPDFDEPRFRENLNMHVSTSPQYGLIASLDVARKQMSMEGHSCLARCFAFADELRSGIDGSGVFRVLSLEDMLPPGLEDDRVRLDPSKLTIDVSRSIMSASQIQRELYSRHSIQLEKTTHNTLSVLVTIGTTQSKVLRLTNAFLELSSDASRCQVAVANEHVETPVLPPPGYMSELPRHAYFADSEYLPLNADSGAANPELLGRVASDQVVPYPPGIPVLVPGQDVDEATLQFLRETAFGEQGIEIHGLLHREGRYFVRVMRVKDAGSGSNLHESAPLSASGT